MFSCVFGGKAEACAGELERPRGSHAEPLGQGPSQPLRVVGSESL